MEFLENVPLATLTTFKIGGPARFFASVSSLEELRQALAFAKEKQLPFFILGGGSNVLADDAGFDGVVIKIALSGIEFEDMLLVAAAGESWDSVVARAVEKNLGGIENLSGIPGTAGAAPVQNIGAYGTEVKDVLEWVETLEVESGRVKKFAKEECEFSYRSSVFKQFPGRYAILRVALRLKQDAAPQLSYKDLAAVFDGVAQPSLAEIRAAVIAIRSKKFPDLAQEGTAGSFFLNPVIPAVQAEALRKRFPDMPQYPGESGVKISLAWLLDHVLGLRGAISGGARLFERQPIVVVAKPGTSSKDVHALAKTVIDRVRKDAGIDIEPEVRMLHREIK